MQTLTALDRCDRCGARAQHVGPHGLLFCAHHARQHGLTTDRLPTSNTTTHT